MHPLSCMHPHAATAPSCHSYAPTELHASSCRNCTLMPQLHPLSCMHPHAATAPSCHSYAPTQLHASSCRNCTLMPQLHPPSCMHPRATTAPTELHAITATSPTPTGENHRNHRMHVYACRPEA
eukprot:1151736-Pelagomonas_calceolata.AAC.1